MAMIDTLLDQQWRTRARDAAQLDALISRERELLGATRALATREDTVENNAHVGRALQRLSEHLAMRGDCDEALELKEEVIALWARLERTRAHFLTRLQRAKILDQRGEDAAATAAFEELEVELAANDQLSNYADFLAEARAFFHAARAERADAVAHLERALRLREQRGNAKQIEQTRALLSRLEAID